MHLNLYVCENFVWDYRQIIEQNHFDFVTVVPFNCLCNDRKKKQAVAQQISEDLGEKIIIASRNCVVSKMLSQDDAQLGVSLGNYCFHDYVNEKFIDYIIEKGGYIVTSGWLHGWEKWLAQAGFDQKTARKFYQECCSELVLLDTGNDPAIEKLLTAFAAYVDLPYRMIYVGMEGLSLYLGKLINEWRQTREGPKEEKLILDELKKKGAEYAAVLHIIEEITGYTKKRDIIAKIKELFAYIFGAGRVRFLEAGDDDYFETYIRTEFKNPEDAFVIDQNRHYLVVKLSRYGETFGALEIGEFQKPGKINDYANFALSVARVSALAISNSVQYELLERSRDEVAYISYHDSLTGLYNRNYFNKATSQHQIPAHTCAFVCDIDGLKRVNDEYGHAWGDELITAAGRVLKKAFRETDLVARVGGDEFYIIVYDCESTTTETLEKRIFTIISTYNESIADHILKLSLSVGYCHGDEENTLGDKPWSWEELFNQADQRMYAQKAEKKIKTETR
ncbi:diguanylate cyclase domain-containing protein [Acetobacterium sp.]|uniref:diguanylate cyclase domain-containing protein n=1 Tax=Acetobacterium sp. TaxID=1872094 RepID=UPI003594812C